VSFLLSRLVNKKAAISFINDVLEATEMVSTMAATIKVPVLIIHGEQDKIASVAATKQFFEEVCTRI
jgi:alpha-beta hydrolase superfamily lysophospholipase